MLTSQSTESRAFGTFVTILACARSRAESRRDAVTGDVRQKNNPHCDANITFPLKKKATHQDTLINMSNDSFVEKLKHGLGFPSKYVSPETLAEMDRHRQDAMTSKLFYISRAESVEGPFTFPQLQEMWRTGAIPANSFYCLTDDQSWKNILTIKDRLSTYASSGGNSNAVPTAFSGYALLIFGFGLLGYYMVFFDSSVSTGFDFLPRVNNLGLLGDKQNGIILGATLSVVGAILLAVSYVGNSRKS